MGSWAQLTPPGIQSHSSGDPAPRPGPILFCPCSPQSTITCISHRRLLHPRADFLGMRWTSCPSAQSSQDVPCCVPPGCPSQTLLPLQCHSQAVFSICPYQPGPGREVGTSLPGPSHKIAAVSRLVPWGGHPAFLPSSQRLWLQALPPSFPL